MFAEDIAIKPLVDLSEKYKDDSIEVFLYELVMDKNGKIWIFHEL